MRCQECPNNWSCLANAFAMALDISIQEVYDRVGHDGSEIKWPALPEPFRRRSFHIQEMIAMCWKQNIWVTEFQAMPLLGPGDNYNKYGEYTYKIDNSEMLIRILDVESRNGVLTGLSGRMPHAVAWNGYEKMIYDAKRTYRIDQFSIQSFWCISY